MSLVRLYFPRSATPVYETTDWAAGYTTSNLSQGKKNHLSNG